MKWIVLWTVVSFCPYSLPPTPDEFGRTGTMVDDCVLRVKECGRSQHSKEFATQEDAQAFYKKALAEVSPYAFVTYESIIDVKLVEVKP